jgi:hypothetical protein
MCWIAREIVVSIITIIIIITTFYYNCIHDFYELHVIAWESAHWIEIRCQIKMYNIRLFCFAASSFFESQ